MPGHALPFVRVHGSPYERGFQHGHQCGDLIHRYPDVLLQTIGQESKWRAIDSDGACMDRDALCQRALAFLPQMQTFAPHLVEEIRGIADGARVPFAEALLINVRAEVMGSRIIGSEQDHAPGGGAASDGCTAFAIGRGATADRSILAGQNLDQNPRNEDLLIVLRVEPNDGPSILMCTFAGLVGYSGLNNNGISLFQNALSTPIWRETGMPHYVLKRVLLEQTQLASCLDVCRRAQVCSSGNYVLTDRDGLLDVEMTPDGFAVVTSEDDLLVHTNHFLSPMLHSQEALLPSIPDSACRAPRMAALLAQQRGHLRATALKAILSDHDDYPTSICRHQDTMISIASMIAEPDQGRLHVAIGNPCENSYATYSL